jgi:site-specific DNA-methyltransferase (adenine-specific)
MHDLHDLQVMPDLSEAEYAALRESIREHGVLVPVVYDERGELLDGHHRLRAAGELGITNYPSEVVPCADDAERRTLARALNCQRRHLSQEQRRALIADQVRDMPTWSDRRIADTLGVSHVTVAGIRADLESTGQIDQLTEREGGDGKVRPARRPLVIAKDTRDRARALTALAELDKVPPRALDARGLEKLVRSAGYTAAGAAEGDATMGTATLLLGDMRERGREIADASVDLLFTDPPYMKEAEHLWPALSELAARVLKPDGLLIAYSGNLCLPAALDGLRAHLRFWMAGSLFMPGPRTQLWAYQVWTRSKPLVWFVRHDFTGPRAWVDNAYASEVVQKDAHRWQQSVGCARYYVERLTEPSDLVLDPFLGGGTTGVAAVELGRQFVGIEVDPEAMATAQARLAKQGAAMTG